MAGEAVVRSPEGPDAPEDLAAAFAAVRDRPPLAEALESGRHRRPTPPRADLARELLKEGPVPDPRAFRAERPGMSRLVPEGLLALGGRQVRRDRDAVRRSVHDLASGQLAPRQANPRRVEPETCGELIVQVLEAGFIVGLFEFKEGVHGLRLAD